MPLPGGEADKLGNRYEGRWTIHCMIDVMDEKADSIRIEPPGDDAFEFFLWRNRQQEYHQVKRQNSQLGRWTLKSLETKQISVLSDIWKYLQNPDVTCVFVSTQDANELTELANRAKGTESLIEFERINGKGLSGEFDVLLQKWGNCSHQDAYQALKRIRVETVGENFLVNAVEHRLEALVEGDPQTIRIELAELILNSIHQELTVHDIWHYLTQEGRYHRREWGKDPRVLAAVEDCNNRYVDRLKDVVIANNIISRDETQTILQKLNSSSRKRSLLVTGEAGVGKSVVMFEVVSKLRKQGTPVLSFRVDNLNPVAHPDDVGNQLQLPGSPALVLANIAQKRKCVLVIDQVDAVSLTSGRNPVFFDCIHEIIQQALVHPNIRLLIACRQFDLDNDHRLKKLTGENGIAETITINRLSHDKVKEVVTDLHLDATRLNSKQLDLLSIPLHLWLLSQIVQDVDNNTLSFQTAKDLFDEFWSYKQRILKTRLNRDVKWTQVIDIICDRMSDQQSLSVQQTIVDDFQADTEAMASEHILVKDNNRLKFFHDSFFDYAFARRFAARGQDLLSFLRSSEQHLFRRNQVRQILIHEREADIDLYLEHLEELLMSDDIRFHLKQIVFAWLRTLDEPTKEEWEIVSSIIKGNNISLIPSAWRSVGSSSSIGWFQQLDSLGIITEWLNDECTNQVMPILWRRQRDFPKRVAELIEPFVGRSQAWLNRISYLILHSELDKERHLFDLFLWLIQEGVFDQKEGTEGFWFKLADLPLQKPDWACEAIGYYLDRSLDLSLEAEQSNPFDHQFGSLPRDLFYEKVLEKSAKHAPDSFVRYILPFMFRVLKLNANFEGEPPWLDPIWQYRSYAGGDGIDGTLLNCMEKVLSSLVANHPDKCSAIIEQQLYESQFETIQYLLILTYAANGQKFADEAINYLCEQPKRLETGYSVCNGNARAARFWATKETLEAITPHCSSENLARLESLILDYYPVYEKSFEYREIRGYTQLILLNAIASSRRSTKANSRLQEWQRKFESLGFTEELDIVKPPKALEASWVGSPIKQKSADYMTDEQWLQAISKYNQDSINFNPDGLTTGGASKLSRTLEDCVKKEPVRFANLIWQLPDDTNTDYFNAVLNGIAKAEAEVNIETAFSTVKRCDELLRKSCGRSISWLFQELAILPWSKQALDVLIYYAPNDRNRSFPLQKSQKKLGQWRFLPLSIN